MWLRVKTWISQHNFSSRYQSLAYTFTNFFVALIALNMLLGLFLRLTDPAAQGGRTHSQVDLRAYHGLPSDRLRQVLNDFDDFSSMGSVYRPYTQIGDPPFESASLNVLRDDYGFEYRKGATPEVSDAPIKVYLFGGSTTFGVHLADEWTLGAKLQEILGEGVSVRNYSVRGFSWYQTHVLFQRLLHAGNTYSSLFSSMERPSKTTGGPEITRLRRGKPPDFGKRRNKACATPIFPSSFRSSKS
ncbi:MAG: hypothetical protein R3B54_12445 [Bdellovibrionota bacterium]